VQLRDKSLFASFSSEKEEVFFFTKKNRTTFVPGQHQTSRDNSPAPQRSPGALALFRLYLRFMFWRRFDAVRVSRSSAALDYPGRPMVVFCNHPSWWDPALMLLALPRLMPGRHAFGPMDAAELERYPVLRKMGVFGIEPNTRRGAAAFLRTAAALLQLPQTMLCITAEGAFTDPRPRPIRLRPGLAHLARAHPDAVYLPLALEYGFWNESKPEALLRFGAPVLPPAGGGTDVWLAAMESALAETLDVLGAESATRDPSRFDILFAGTAGVGGIYDIWRRLKALVTRRRFVARHDRNGRR
jgi:1-acyl-sn-glycerol-3-phosphate acyltransferase